VATYYDIFGQKVQYLSSDPANVTEGQVWYNSTSNTAKFEGFLAAGSGTWSTGNNFNTNRSQIGGAGTATSGFIAGGYQQPYPGSTVGLTATEEWDGTNWTTGGSLNTGRADINCAGTETAGLAASGDRHPSPPRTMTENEEYNGTAWTNVNPTQNGHYETASSSVGIQTAATMLGGRSAPPTTRSNFFESYDGTSWTNNTAYPSSYSGANCFGTESSQVAAGGENPGGSVVTDVNEWNGSAWTAGNALPVAKRNGMGSGTLTNGIVAFGAPTPNPSSSSYDGTNWTTEGTVNTPMSSMGSSTSALVGAWGANWNGSISATETFSGINAPTTKTITTS